MENITNLRPVGEDFRWYLKVRWHPSVLSVFQCIQYIIETASAFSSQSFNHRAISKVLFELGIGPFVHGRLQKLKISEYTFGQDTIPLTL